MARTSAGLNSIAAANTHRPNGNVAAVITYAAVEGKAHVVKGLSWSYDGDPAAGSSLKIESPSGTVVFEIDITSKGPGFIPWEGEAAQNVAVIITLAAAGGSIKGKVNVHEHYLN